MMVTGRGFFFCFYQGPHLKSSEGCTMNGLSHRSYSHRPPLTHHPSRYDSPCMHLLYHVIATASSYYPHYQCFMTRKRRTLFFPPHSTLIYHYILISLFISCSIACDCHLYNYTHESRNRLGLYGTHCYLSVSYPLIHRHFLHFVCRICIHGVSPLLASAVIVRCQSS